MKIIPKLFLLALLLAAMPAQAARTGTGGVLGGGTSGGGGGTAGVSSFTGDGTILNNSGSTGAVTATLANQSANAVLAGPASGSAAAPTFRAHVVADMPPFIQAVTANAAMVNFGGL